MKNANWVQSKVFALFSLPIQEFPSQSSQQKRHIGGRTIPTSWFLVLISGLQLVNESEIAEAIPSLLRISRRIVGSIDDAEEVVQGALLEIIQNKDRWNRIESWQGFLRHLVTKRSLDRLRKRPPPDPLSSEPNDPSQLQPIEHSMQQELLEQFRNALSSLSDREAEVFSMRYLADHTNIEISQQLSMSQNSVAVLLKRARTKLQHLMEMEAHYDR